MTYKPKIKKVLVVLSPELVKPANPLQSPLLKRAVALAKRTGCELELFHVCYDSTLENQLFASDVDLMRQRAIVTDRAALQVAEIATRLQDECVDISHEVRWDSPRTDAILRKVAAAQPDVVMKHGRDHSYLFGISSNTDWDLARRSPSHVWFVNDGVGDIDRIVAAVGNKLGDSVDVTTLTDQQLLKAAGFISDAFNAEIYPVNAFQVPPTHIYTTHVGGTVTPVRSVEEQQKSRDQIVRRHKEAVRALAQFAGIPKENVRVCEGHPNEVIPREAGKVAAHMIVMGGQSISRLERLINNVTVEPVIAESDSDIFVVRENDLSDVPVEAGRPYYGIPQYDLEHAITNPEDTFDSPQVLANLSEVSIALRRRILQAWEYDIRAEMAAENEGGNVDDIDVNALDEIFAARALLDMKKEAQRQKEPKTLSLSA